jgi:DNA-directed RNA polymerase specialized sigma24 family protein
MRVFKLTTFGAGEEEIAELLGIELESVARTKRRLAQKLKKSAAKSGFSEQIG